MRNVHTGSHSLARIILACGVLALAAGCTELGDEFRAAASPSLQSGITQVLTGMVDGAFAVVEPGKGEDGTSGGG